MESAALTRKHSVGACAPQPLTAQAFSVHNHKQVELLVTWASVGRYELLATTLGPRGVTPMHLAALLPDQGAMAAALVGAPYGVLGAQELSSAEGKRIPSRRA